MNINYHMICPSCNKAQTNDARIVKGWITGDCKYCGELYSDLAGTRHTHDKKYDAPYSTFTLKYSEGGIWK